MHAIIRHVCSGIINIVQILVVAYPKLVFPAKPGHIGIAFPNSSRRLSFTTAHQVLQY